MLSLSERISTWASTSIAKLINLILSMREITCLSMSKCISKNLYEQSSISIRKTVGVSLGIIIRTRITIFRTKATTTQKEKHKQPHNTY